MKSKKQGCTFLLASLLIIGCTACKVNEVGSEGAAPIQSITDNTQSVEAVQTLEKIELKHTFLTQFGATNENAFPCFAFDYPDGWTITSEGVAPESELIELTNDKGVVVRYQYIVPAYAYGNMRVEMGAEISKLADSSFAPDDFQAAAPSEQGGFVVAKVKTTSAQNLRTDPEPTQSDSDSVSYAVMPESECGSGIRDGNFVTAFKYDGLLQFMAETPNPLTIEEEQEVVAILASLRVSDREASAEPVQQEGVTAEDNSIYTALQKGDFSYFAGTYKPCGIYHEMYGGGEHLPNLVLQENGIVTGGLVYGAYPETKPTTVTKNEDGSYLCQVEYSSNKNQNYFLIYPEGVIGENPYIYNDPLLTETAYIQYISVDGGISDIIYYKIDD